jgi:hypothetical protein
MTVSSAIVTLLGHDSVTWGYDVVANLSTGGTVSRMTPVSTGVREAVVTACRTAVVLGERRQPCAECEG